jgi:hypothetical protein
MTGAVVILATLNQASEARASFLKKRSKKLLLNLT